MIVLIFGPYNQTLAALQYIDQSRAVRFNFVYDFLKLKF